MATIQIRPERFKSAADADHFMTVEDQTAVAAIDDEDVEPWWVATCTCGVSGADRGNFEDTTQWALIHVEGAHE
jgi:hypothetical protein